MDLSSLEIFRAVATEQSVTRAATQLSRVQSNVTTRVRQLEDELKVQLFSRDGKRMTLTSNGQCLLDYAQRLLSLAEEARQAMHTDGPSGRLRIGSMESTAAARLPALLASYHSRWPEVDLGISIGTSRSLLRDVSSGKVDCAFIADARGTLNSDLKNVLIGPGFDAMQAYPEELILVLPPNHPPARGPADLKISTLAAFQMGCTYRNVLENWLSGTHGTPDREWQVVEHASYHTMLACVAAGSCFALCPRSVLELKRVPMDVKTHSIAWVDTYLVSRSAYSSAAHDELIRLIETRRRSVIGRVVV